MVGDFAQLGPCSEHHLNNDSGDPEYVRTKPSYAFQSKAWPALSFANFYLMFAWRFMNDPCMQALMTELRLATKMTDTLWSSLEEILRREPPSTGELTMLTPTRAEAKAISDNCVAGLRTPCHTFRAIDCPSGRTGMVLQCMGNGKVQPVLDVFSNGSVAMSTDDFGGMRPVFESITAAAELTLASGARVLCISNLCYDGHTFVNGSVMKVVRWRKLHTILHACFFSTCGADGLTVLDSAKKVLRPIVVDDYMKFLRLLCGDHFAVPFCEAVDDKGEKVIFPALPRFFTVCDDGDGHVICWRFQLPLVLAYALTIHKSQGLTLDKVCFAMNKLFQHGMMYTALSRVRSYANLFMEGHLSHKLKLADPIVVQFYKTCCFSYVDNGPDHGAE